MPSIVVAHVAMACSVYVAVQLGVSAPTCRGFWLMRSSTQPLAPRGPSTSRPASTLGRQIPRRPLRLAFFARAVLELCHDDPWLSVPIRRRGAHVAPSCDLNAALLMPKWTSAVLTLISSGCIWYLHVKPGVYRWNSKSIASFSRIVSPCSRHRGLFTLRVSLPCRVFCSTGRWQFCAP